MSIADIPTKSLAKYTPKFQTSEKNKKI